jgi:hypothetical protein
LLARARARRRRRGRRGRRGRCGRRRLQAIARKGGRACSTTCMSVVMEVLVVIVPVAGWWPIFALAVIDDYGSRAEHRLRDIGALGHRHLARIGIWGYRRTRVRVPPYDVWMCWTRAPRAIATPNSGSIVAVAAIRCPIIARVASACCRARKAWWHEDK